MTKLAVLVMPRDVVLDSQGRAIENVIHEQFNQPLVQNIRIGKWIEMDMDMNLDQAKNVATKLAQEVLHNPLIEKFEVRIIS